MDPRFNPYAPGSGTPPPELAGRDAVLVGEGGEQQPVEKLAVARRVGIAACLIAGWPSG
ncbi:MAG: hypothetical protein OXC26_00905 [Albidovulum sp.]|nr:hypothetical protein [Albidovulum sp.]